MPGRASVAAGGCGFSWAQLRHDTLLYAKPSYTSGAVCELPDAAVDPYPEFWAAIASYADKGTLLVSALLEPTPLLAHEIEPYLGALRDIAVNLQGIAEAQRDHRALSESQLWSSKKPAAACRLTSRAAGTHACSSAAIRWPLIQPSRTFIRSRLTKWETLSVACSTSQTDNPR